MLFNSEDVKFINEEPSKSSSIWSKDATILKGHRRLWTKVPHKGRLRSTKPTEVSEEQRAVVWTDSSFASQEDQKSQGAVVLTHCMAPVYWKCARQALVAMSTAESELQMLCEGSLATRNVGMLVKETMKPMKEVIKAQETIQELNEREEFALDDEQQVEVGEEDLLLVDNKAATMILVQESGSWRTRRLRVRASSLKQRISSGIQKVVHVAGRSMLADLDTKSHSDSRLTALRKMWSIERIDQPETEEKSSESDVPKTKVKMIRIKPSTAPMNVDEEGEEQKKKLEEQGYRIGARGNQSETDLETKGR